MEEDVNISVIVLVFLFLLLAFNFLISLKTRDFTAREFCILEAKTLNKTVDEVIEWDTSCFHPFEKELAIFECRIKCRYMG